MLNLYHYQKQTIGLIREGFKTHQRQIMCAPTGSGKTVMFSTIVAAAVQKGSIVLVLTDRLELFAQTVESVKSFEIPVARIDASQKVIYSDASLYVGMVETVKRRATQLKFQGIEFDLIIVDEAHMASFNKIFELWPHAYVIGATATPVGKHLHKYYTNLVSCIDTPELVQEGFLTPCRAYQMQDNMEDLKVDKSGEFTEASLFLHYDKAKLYEGVVEKYLEKCANQKTIVFNVNIQHTLHMTEAFNKVGIKSYSVTSKTPEAERKWILSEFAAGSFPVLNNCGILTKGYNEPSIQNVILNRATNSIALYLQMIGRGSRIYPEKKYFTVLDFGMNHNRHGLWNEARTWELKPPKKKKKGVGAIPIRQCVSCGALLPAVQKKCEYCGHELGEAEIFTKPGELVEVGKPAVDPLLIGKKISELNIEELVKLEATGQYKSAYIWRVMRSRGQDAVIAYAAIKGYKNGWIARQLETMEQEGNTEFLDLKVREKIHIQSA